MARGKKITALTDNSGWVEPKKKVRKKRKPMTDEQKQAAAERLEKAREKRAEKNPDYGMSGVHHSLRDLPDDHRAHPKKVKQWIKTQKELASEERRAAKQNMKGAYAKQCMHEGYIRNLVKYLRDGDYVDDFYGEYQEHRVKRRCIAMAYHADGMPKRNVGTYYPDMGCEYTQEMYNEEKGIVIDETPKKRKRRKRSKRAVA
tara:strand:- start:725 stop:1330 length:606 start_codon:yes stop_codon:yes gene_type:complete